MLAEAADPATVAAGREWRAPFSTLVMRAHDGARPRLKVRTQAPARTRRPRSFAHHREKRIAWERVRFAAGEHDVFCGSDLTTPSIDDLPVAQVASRHLRQRGPTVDAHCDRMNQSTTIRILAARAGRTVWCLCSTGALRTSNEHRNIYLPARGMGGGVTVNFQRGVPASVSRTSFTRQSPRPVKSSKYAATSEG